MTLHTYPDVVQGTPEWDDLRRGVITASAIGSLITPKTVKPAANAETRSLVAQLAADRMNGWTDSSYQSYDMALGHENEPRAIDAYAQHRGVTVSHVGFMLNDTYGFPLGYSPDALVEDDGLVEAKSRRAKIHVQHVTGGGVPSEHMAQIQTGLLVTERDWLDYVSYCGGMELWIRRVHPDETWFTAIISAAKAAEEAIEQLVAKYTDAVKGMPMTERIDPYLVELKL